MPQLLNFSRDNTIAINNRIKRLSNYGEPQEDFLFANINEFSNSAERKLMLEAWNYYTNEPDIKEKKRLVIDRKGNTTESKVLTNTKLSHAFMKKLTKQKLNYLLKKPPTTEHEDSAFVELLAEHFNDKFHKSLKSVGRDAIVKGKAWVQAYYDATGVLKFKRIPSEQIMPFWSDEDHTILDGAVRAYSMTLYLPDGVTKEITKVEYYTPEGVWYYEMTKDGLIPDPDKGDLEGPKGHFQVMQPKLGADGKAIVDPTTGAEEVVAIEALWDRVPLVCFKYNAEELPLLQFTKSLIDDYDKNTSDLSDSIQDVPTNIKVVKNYDGASVEEFTQNLNSYRTVFVSSDGDVTSLATPVDVVAVDSHLTRLRKDIFIFGNGVDTQETDLGNASGVSLAFRTMDLENDMEDMGTEFAVGLQELAYFVRVHAAATGKGEYDETTIKVVYSLDTIVNVKELSDIAKDAVGVISDKTRLARHPWVTNVEEELKQIEEERVKSENDTVELTKKMEAAYGTPEPNEGE